ncbi:MAG: mannose-6-phosphate isomerase, class I [bacterium]|nr:mannose-6-phosphate isomerase, class I [bacterium]
MRELLFMEPVFKESIWGGDRLGKEYEYDIPSNHTGECWAISAHPNGDCTIKNGTYAGHKLSEVYKEHRELFGNVPGDKFPLLVKIIDAKEDLSIQVHPDDLYAKTHEHGSLGKTECWYILDCDNEDGSIVVGHHAKDKEELAQMINEHRWKELINVRKIKKDDFFQITPGTVHAIKAGTLILETQQSSDITYRLYDYDRLQNGKKRDLHIKQSIDVITCPYIDEIAATKEIEDSTYKVKELVNCQFYSVHKVDIFGKALFHLEQPFQLVSVIEGNGSIDSYSIKKGDHFIIPSTYDTYTMNGNMQLIVSSL